MRYFILAATAASLLPHASAAETTGTVSTPAVEPAQAAPNSECRKPTSYKAESELAWRERPPVLKKLHELPPAQGYMAVYRSVDGCEVPMTVVEYRSGRLR